MDSETKDILRLDTAWTYKVSVLADLIARRITHVVQTQAGLNLSQWRVLAAIADKPGRTSADVVTLTPMDKGIVSRAARTLIEKNLIRREASQRDGRISHLYMTEAGEASYDQILRALKDSGADGLDALPRFESEQLLSNLDHAIAAYRAHTLRN